jgi:catecholate siderophore receptor
MPSWRAALEYKPTHEGNVYFAAGTSFDPSAEQSSLSAATVVVAPEKNRSYEVGSKWTFLDDDLAVSGAMFQTDKLNAREPSAIDPTIDVLSGHQRVSGFEIQAVGRITEAWQVTAGYANMSGTVLSSPNPLEVGNSLSNTPRHTFSLWTTYEMPWNTQVGGGMSYVSSRTTSTTPNATNGLMQRVDGYMTFDLMAKYHLTEHVDLQANLINLTDKYYLDQLHPSHIVPGPGRTALFSVAYRY